MTTITFLRTDLNYKFSSNETFRNGIFETGIPTDINPPILIIIEAAYKTVSGNTNEYHPTILTIIENEYKTVSGNTNEYHQINSPNPKRPRPTATKRVAFFLP